MNKIFIFLLLLVLAGCASNRDVIVTELQSKIDEQTKVIEAQKKEILEYSLKMEEMNGDITALLHADLFGGINDKYREYYDLNVVNGAADFEELNKLNAEVNQDVVGLYAGKDDLTKECA